MTAYMTFSLGPDQLDDRGRRVARRWPWYVVGGAGVTVIGILLLLNLFTAAKTIAVLAAIALAFQGIDEIVNAPRYRPPWPGYVLGVLLLGFAVWALAWPDITLWAVAVVTGIGLIVTGVVQGWVVLRYHHDMSHRWLFLVLAVVSIVIGVVAIAWPAATILVLSIILGIRVTLEGLTLIAYGIGLRSLSLAIA